MTNHMDHLEWIAKQDVATLRDKERTYGGSWKKRGGVGAFMMLARKMDRLENIAAAANYDIFAVIRGEGLEGADGTLIAEIRDLRCYLMLVEAEMMAREEVEKKRAKTTEMDALLVAPPNIGYADAHTKWSGQFVDESAIQKTREAHSCLVTSRTDHPAPFGYTGED